MENKPVPPSTDKPTTTDSLALYNNSKKVQSYYDTKDYKSEGTIFHKDGFHSAHYINDEAAKEFVKKSSITAPAKNGKPVDVAPSKVNYRKDINDNQYLQRENADNILDTRAPMQLFDKRIRPNVSTNYRNRKMGDSLYGDQVAIQSYDLIGIKPVSMLTPEERKKRAAVYGDISNESTKTQKQIVNQSPSKSKPLLTYKPLVKDTRKPTPQALQTKQTLQIDQPVVEKAEPVLQKANLLPQAFTKKSVSQKKPASVKVERVNFGTKDNSPFGNGRGRKGFFNRLAS